MEDKGKLVISLDFELYWGVRYRCGLDDYRINLQNARSAIPVILNIFKDFDIHASWAVTGFLFFNNKLELLSNLPNKIPEYEESYFSPYSNLESVGEDEENDPYHFAPSLIKKIQSTRNQEIATHTFSHYYCLEKGQSIEEFREDLRAAQGVARKNGIELKSLVFPRNQYNSEYIKICKEFGIAGYRGNEESWIYRASNTSSYKSFYKKMFRLMDTYINLTGHHAYSLNKVGQSFPYNISSSRFLRPYSEKYKMLEPLRLKRILSGLTFAAKNNLVYHLWWHPHNFGTHTDRSVDFLKRILSHYEKLQKLYGMQSLNMEEIAEHINLLKANES